MRNAGPRTTHPPRSCRYGVLEWWCGAKCRPTDSPRCLLQCSSACRFKQGLSTAMWFVAASVSWVKIHLKAARSDKVQPSTGKTKPRHSLAFEPTVEVQVPPAVLEARRQMGWSDDRLHQIQGRNMPHQSKNSLASEVGDLQS